MSPYPSILQSFLCHLKSRIHHFDFTITFRSALVNFSGATDFPPDNIDPLSGKSYECSGEPLNPKQILQAEVALADVLVLEKLLAGPAYHDGPILQNVPTVREGERMKHILFY